MSNPPDSRTVRVFLSSTFRDFAEERDLLITKVFPELRRKCRERQVELVDVDLRWGITDKEAQQGKVLPICLAEIDRSRPYFMGFIGERYGWVPEKDQYDLSLIIEQPWLDKHRGGKSVTELEMLHGVLNNPAMEDRAFFYFRDATYSQKKGGHYLSESPEDKAKLEGLKDRIRKSGFPVVENYKNPEALAERVKDDLWKLIDEAYPESEAPDALTQERMRHEAYSATRRRLYLGGERYYETLNEAMKAKPFRSVLITGQSGGGKSALLSNWMSEWSKRNKKAAVIMHHLGCGADAADPVQMATRLMKEIARLTGDEYKPESDPDKTLEKLSEWLAMASAWAQRSKKELLIVLDGLDKLSDRQHLRWFPAFLPPRVKLVASCLHGHILDAAKARLNWLELKVRPFTKTEQKEFIGKYLGRYRKSLTTKQTRTLQGHSLSGNPLFLLTVLEELRVFGVHEKLETRLGELLSPPPSKAQDEEPTVDDVFEHVLARIEEDLGRKPVQAAMEAIWASRSGLYQDELLSIANLPPSQWATIQIALDESLYDSGGKINFGHDYLRKAVEDRYGLTGERRTKLHRKLAEWFDKQEADENVSCELPWQWQQAGAKKELSKCLLDQNIFVSHQDINSFEFLQYWNYVGLNNISIKYKKAIDKWDDKKFSSLSYKVAIFLMNYAGLNDKYVEFLLSEAIKRLAATEKKSNLGFKCEHALGEIARQRGEYAKAEKFLKKLAIGQGNFSEIALIDILEVKVNYAFLLWNLCQLDAAESLAREICQLSDSILNEGSSTNAPPSFVLAQILCARGYYTEGISLLKKEYKTSKIKYGESHIITKRCKMWEAKLIYWSGEYQKAWVIFNSVYEWQVNYLGYYHADSELSRFYIALIMAEIGELDAAAKIIKLELDESCKKYGHSNHETLSVRAAYSDVLMKQGNLLEAEKHLSKCIKTGEQTLEKKMPNHADVMTWRVSFAKLRLLQKRYSEAEKIARQGYLYFSNFLKCSSKDYNIILALNIIKKCKKFC